MVCCSECGFLTLRNRLNYELVEADDDFRESGQAVHECSPSPLCFAMVPDPRKEAGSSPDSRVVLNVITKSRDCPKFTPWQQGFSPKEHAEMLHEKAMEELRETREEKDRQWRAAQEQERRELEDRREKERWDREARQATSSRRFQIVNLLVGAAVTLASGLASGGLVYYLAKMDPAAKQQTAPQTKP
jgi:hypothetical protein